MEFDSKMKLGFAVAGLALTMVRCDVGNTYEVVVPPLLDEFAHKPLSLDPIAAMEAGYHVYTDGADEEGGASVELGGLLGDYSAAGIQERISFYRDFDARLHGEKTSVPRNDIRDRDMWANFGVVENRVQRSLYVWETRQQHVSDPNFYVEILGRALFGPLVLNYASADERYGHIVSRLEKVPEFLSQAQGNLQSSSTLQIDSAKSQVAGLVSLVQNDISEQLPDSLRGRYDAAAPGAVNALQDFSTFLDALSSGLDWRLGSALFEGKLKVDSASDDIDLDATLSELQTEYDAVYKSLLETARPIHRKIYGNQRPPSEFALMRDILDIVSDDNRLRSEDQMVDRIVEYIGEAKKFMQSQELLPFPDSVQLSVSQTPGFLRSRFPVSAFLAPPTLNPSSGAEFWLSPLSDGASRNALLAKLREYNNFKLRIVAVDAFARFTQAALSATGEPESSETTRLIRNVDPNRAYTRGWVWYLVDSTIDLGFNAGSPEFKMNWLKYKLEFLANAILDIKLHTQGMSEADARTMLERQVFVEKGAVPSAVRSIQLNPTDSAIAYLGAKKWQIVRDRYQEITTDFSYSSFHGKALRAGPLPPAESVYITTNGEGKLEE